MFDLFRKKSKKAVLVKEPDGVDMSSTIKTGPSDFRRSETLNNCNKPLHIEEHTLPNGKKVTVYDNFLDQFQFDMIFRTFTQANFPWYLNEMVVEPNDGLFQFVHVFYTGNEWCTHERNLLVSVVDRIGEHISKQPILIRIKANLRTHSKTEDASRLHSDCGWLDRDFKHKTGILYVNDCDGYTFFEGSDLKIQSKENRFVCFDSDVRHGGTAATWDPPVGKHRHRFLINFNWY